MNKVFDYIREFNRGWFLHAFVVLPMLIAAWAQRIENFRGRYFFVDRSKQQKRLLIVVAGFKADLWPVVFPRLKAFVPESIDVCICLPGANSPEIYAIAEMNRWSVLRTGKNRLALAQNLAIRLHPNADFIFKVDEDILVGSGYFENLERCLIKVKEDGFFDPGMIVPTINVNGNTYVDFLREIGCLDEYVEAFGECRQACLGVRAQSCGEAAVYLWQKSLPFDPVVHRFCSKDLEYRTVAMRFSIGAFLMERRFIEEAGWFRVSKDGGLGREEKTICEQCMDMSRPIIVCNNAFAGHFAFGPQNAAMNSFLERNRALFELSAPQSLVTGS